MPEQGSVGATMMPALAGCNPLSVSQGASRWCCLPVVIVMIKGAALYEELSPVPAVLLLVTIITLGQHFGFRE